MAEPHFEPEIYRTFFGVENEEDIHFAEDMLTTLGEIDRALVPRGQTHPYIDWIRKGAQGEADLLKFLQKPMTGTAVGDVLDALGFIFVHTPASDAARNAIRSYLGHPSFADIAARTLALGGDEAFLTDLMSGLASDDPGEVASAALLMGYGRFQPAIPLLTELISPMRFIESRAVIWALGELKANEAIPQLTRCLADSFRPIDAMIALGKIGNPATSNLLIPYIIQGHTEAREIALRALSMLLAQNAEYPEVLSGLSEVFTEILSHISQEDPSRTARFYALLALGRLGQKMKQDLIRKALGMSLREDEMSSFQNFFMRNRKK